MVQIILKVMLLATLPIQAAELPPLTHSLATITPPFAAPALRLNNMDEEIVDIKDLHGKVIVLNFWATWCPPCRREMNSLEALNLATADKNVVVLAVNIAEDIETVFSFLGTMTPSPSFPILFDSTGLSLEQWQVLGLPTTYIIDRTGQVTYKAIGGREFDHPDILQKIIALSQTQKVVK